MARRRAWLGSALLVAVALAVAAGVLRSRSARIPGAHTWIPTEHVPSSDYRCPLAQGATPSAIETPDLVLVPGVGIGGVKIGVSRADDVLRAYGCDARISQYDTGDHEVFGIDYDYDGNGVRAPDRWPNDFRPSFDLKHGVVAKIDIGVVQKRLRTEEGIGIGSTRPSTILALGTEVTVRKITPDVETYQFATLGLEVDFFGESAIGLTAVARWVWTPAEHVAAKNHPCPLGENETPAALRVPDLVVVPGVGIGGIRVGVSTAEDVLRAYGCDAKIESTHPDALDIDYSYDGFGLLDADRFPNRQRPEHFHLELGVVREIEVGAYQELLHTSKGFGVDSSKKDMIAELGTGFMHEESPTLDAYRYGAIGLTAWIVHDDDVISFFVVPRE